MLRFNLERDNQPYLLKRKTLFWRQFNARAFYYTLSHWLIKNIMSCVTNENLELNLFQRYNLETTCWINSTTHRRVRLQYTHSILRGQRVRWKLLGEEGDGRDGRNERPRQDVRQFRFVLFDGRLVDKKLQSFRFVGHAVRVWVH